MPRKAASHLLTWAGRTPWTWAVEGAFEIVGLPEGTYDLHVHRERGPFDCSPTNFRGPGDIPAGSEDVELRLPVVPTVRVRVTVDDGGVPFRGMWVMHNRVDHLGTEEGMPTPPRVVASDLTSWTGISGWSIGNGGMSKSVYVPRSITYDRECAQKEGWYQWGVEAVVGGKLGRPSHHPVATGPLYLQEGEYEIHFELTPSAALHGEVIGNELEGELALALATPEGAPIRVPDLNEKGNFGAILQTVPIDAAGEFAFNFAPVGTHLLRVGTLDQLRRGEFLHEEPVEVSLGGTGPIVVEL